MLVGRITPGITRYRSPFVIHGGPDNHRYISILVNHFRSLPQFQHKLTASHKPLLHKSTLNSLAFQRFGISSSASPQSEEKGIENGRTANNSNDAKENANSNDKYQGEEDLTMEDMIKLVTEKEQLLKTKQEEIEKMKDIMDRTKREAENSKKFAIQNFAKSLLDVADNLERTSSVVKTMFSMVDTSEASASAVPLLETLVEGVEMTDKQLAEVLMKFGVEKYDPTNQEFDPNRHNAVFHVPDATRPPGTVTLVFEKGYMLHDRIIRPAEVGVTIKSD